MQNVAPQCSASLLYMPTVSTGQASSLSCTYVSARMRVSVRMRVHVPVPVPAPVPAPAPVQVRACMPANLHTSLHELQSPY